MELLDSELSGLVAPSLQAHPGGDLTHSNRDPTGSSPREEAQAHTPPFSSVAPSLSSIPQPQQPQLPLSPAPHLKQSYSGEQLPLTPALDITDMYAAAGWFVELGWSASRTVKAVQAFHEQQQQHALAVCARETQENEAQLRRQQQPDQHQHKQHTQPPQAHQQHTQQKQQENKHSRQTAVTNVHLPPFQQPLPSLHPALMCPLPTEQHTKLDWCIEQMERMGVVISYEAMVRVCACM